MIMVDSCVYKYQGDSNGDVLSIIYFLRTK